MNDVIRSRLERRQRRVQLLANRKQIDQELSELEKENLEKAGRWEASDLFRVGPLNIDLESALEAQAINPGRYDAFNEQFPVVPAERGKDRPMFHYGLQLWLKHPCIKTEKTKGQKALAVVYFRDHKKDTWEQTLASAEAELDTIGKASALCFNWGTEAALWELADLEKGGQIHIDPTQDPG